MTLHGYWRSSSTYRVRIALNLKGISYRTVPVNLLAREQTGPFFAALNPALGVPVLELDDGTVLTQSVAILEWLEETHPAPALLPAAPLMRARVRAAALVIASEIHPANNLRILDRLKATGHGPEDTASWMAHWIHQGLAALEVMMADETPFGFGAMPGLADLCLIPQLYNARRSSLDLSPFPRLTAIEAACLALPAFQAAAPEAQPDAPKGQGG